jgi:hypothetical protein
LEFDDVGDPGQLAGQVQGEESPPPRSLAAGIQHRGEVECGRDDEAQAMSVGHRGRLGGGAHRIALLGRWREGPGFGVVQDTVDPGAEPAAADRALERGG